MLSTKTNYHHSKLPRLGSIGHLIHKYDRWDKPVYYEFRESKCDYGRYNGGIQVKPDPVQVVAFPLCDNVLPYSRGIHTAFFQNLRTGEIKRFSGHYFEERN